MKVNNGDMPAMPLTGDAYTDFAAFDGTNKTSYNPECQGMTKREQFAVMAMQGLLSSASDSDGVWTHSGSDNVAFEAVLMADALLKQLEKKGE
jgi:hypothetical protein